MQSLELVSNHFARLYEPFSTCAFLGISNIEFFPTPYRNTHECASSALVAQMPMRHRNLVHTSTHPFWKFVNSHASTHDASIPFIVLKYSFIPHHCSVPKNETPKRPKPSVQSHLSHNPTYANWAFRFQSHYSLRDSIRAFDSYVSRFAAKLVCHSGPISIDFGKEGGSMVGEYWM